MGALDSKSVIVTGAGSGIGRAIAIELALQGAAVVAADVNEAGLAETKAAVPSAELTTRVVDVTQEDDVRAVVAFAVESYGRLSAIVNNAGISIPNAVADATLEEFDRTFAVNVRGTFLGCKHAVPELLRAGGGAIVNIGSINSLVAEPQLALYCASKGAVLMLTRAIAVDYAPVGIRCNCVCPGFVDTPINVPHSQRLDALGLAEALSQFQPLARAILPAEVAAAVAFLVSDASSAITGTALLVDGGVTAKA